jgi:AAA domain
LQWYTISQLREETAAEIRYLVDGILAESSLAVIGGKIAVGKSTLARTLAYCVTHGLPFLGCETQQGAVLYVAPEESKHGVMADLVALGFTDNDPLHLCFASSENVLEQVLAKMQETQARLVIFETIFRVLKIKDVNDYAQSTARLDPVLALARQTSAHVLFTHHLGKRDTTDALDALLGSTAIGGTPDTRIILKKKGDMRTVEVIQRYGNPLPETVLEYNPETKFISIGGLKSEHDEKLIRDQILILLQAQEEDQEKGQPLTEAQIGEEVEGRTIHKRKALRSLVKDEKVERIGKGGKKDPFRYCLKASRYSCSHVPTYIQEQGNKNQKTDLSSQKNDGYSCSRDSQKNDSCSRDFFDDAREEDGHLQQWEDDL